MKPPYSIFTGEQCSDNTISNFVAFVDANQHHWPDLDVTVLRPWFDGRKAESFKKKEDARAHLLKLFEHVWVGSFEHPANKHINTIQMTMASIEGTRATGNRRISDRVASVYTPLATGREVGKGLTRNTNMIRKSL